MNELPDLDAVAAFVALADCGSFAAAGRRIGRDATIVTRRITTLEARLGVRLAERTTRKVTLTEAGCAYLERVRPLLTEFDAAARDVATFGSGTPRGHLRIALPTSFGRMWVSPLLPEFLRTHPAVTIEAEFSNGFVDLIGGRFDLAVRLGTLPDSRLIARAVLPRVRLLCAAPAYLARAGVPDDPDALRDHACLRFTGKANPHVWEFLDTADRLLSVPVTGPLASDDADALVDAAVAGVGLLYATDWLVARQLAAGTLVPVLADWRIPQAGGIYVVIPSAAGLPAKTRAFSDWLVDRLRRQPPWQRWSLSTQSDPAV